MCLQKAFCVLSLFLTWWWLLSLVPFFNGLASFDLALGLDWVGLIPEGIASNHCLSWESVAKK